MFATNSGQAHSPPCQGGVDAPLTKWIRSEKARTGWSLTSVVSECVSETCCVSDHPVYGCLVASHDVEHHIKLPSIGSACHFDFCLNGIRNEAAFVCSMVHLTLFNGRRSFGAAVGDAGM